MDESFSTRLQPAAADDYTLSIRPSLEFSFEKAKDKILKLADILPHFDRISLEIPDDTLGGDGQKTLRMGEIIEWQNKVCVILCIYDS